MTEEKKLEPELRFPGFHEPWEEKKLGDVFEFIKTYSYSRKNEGFGEYHHVHYGDIHSRYGVFIDNSDDIPTITEKKNHTELKKGDIVVADASEDFKDLGKAVVLLDNNDRKIIGGLHTFVLRSKEDLSSKFYAYYMRTDDYRKKIQKIGTGTSVYGISKRNYKQLLIQSSLLEEQEKIGKFFSTIDKKLNLQRERIEELKSYKKGMMQRIFDQEIRFKDENGRDYPDWEETLVGELFDLTRGVVIAKKTLSSVKDNIYKYPVYSSQTINEGVLGWDKTYDFDKRILSWTTDGANAGKVELREGKYRCTNVCGIMLEKDTTKGFANKCLANIIDRETPKYVSYVGNPKLMNNVMREVKVIIPSLPEQEKIANFLSAIDKRIELEEEKLEFYEDFKKGLMQRMFV